MKYLEAGSFGNRNSGVQNAYAGFGSRRPWRHARSPAGLVNSDWAHISGSFWAWGDFAITHLRPGREFAALERALVRQTEHVDLA